MGKRLLISKRGVKRFLRENGVRVSVGFYAALNDRIKTLLTEAAKRAKNNGRSTVLPHDA